VFEAFKCGLPRHKVYEVSRGERLLLTLRSFFSQVDRNACKIDKNLNHGSLEWLVYCMKSCLGGLAFVRCFPKAKTCSAT